MSRVFITGSSTGLGLIRVGLHTRAVTVYRDTLSEGFSPLRYLHSCPGCFRLERSPGGTCTHWKAPPCHGAHPTETLACQIICDAQQVWPRM